MKKGTSRLKWWAWRLAASLAAGIGVTLGVAYIGAIWNDRMEFGGWGEGDIGSLRETNRWWDVVTIVDKHGDQRTVARVMGTRQWLNDGLVETETRQSEGITVSDLGYPRQVYLIGWPARCLWGVETGANGPERVGLAAVPLWLEEIRYVQHPLPTRPWWPGMLTNVSLFGGAFLALLAGPGAVRRWRWKRRGACLGCGYDVRGVEGGVCPECGGEAAVGGGR